MIIPPHTLGLSHDNVTVVNVALFTVSDLGAEGTRKRFNSKVIRGYVNAYISQGMHVRTYAQVNWIIWLLVLLFVVRICIT